MATRRPIGIPWYSKDTYGRTVAVMSDRNNLPDTFGEWLLAAENAERQINHSGALAVRAMIGPTFPTWCREQGLRPDSEARQQYAALAARLEVQTGGNA